MAPFSETQMCDELGAIFLFEAEHIQLGAGPAYAENFIGFASEGSYVDEPVSRVDLDRFAITRIFRWAYAAAFTPSITQWSGGLEEHDEILTFMQGLPRIGSVGGGEAHEFMGSNGFCQTVCDIIHDRWKLEWHDGGAGGHTFTTRELALLANMSEGAVRNAMADKTGNGLKAIAGSKPVSVEHDEAWRWLNGRRGFVPIPRRPADDRYLHSELKDLDNAQAFGKFVAKQVALDTSSAETLVASGWEEADLAAWSGGSFIFARERTIQLAQALNLDVPLFVGKALEVALRRDIVEEGDRS